MNRLTLIVAFLAIVLVPCAQAFSPKHHSPGGALSIPRAQPFRPINTSGAAGMSSVSLSAKKGKTSSETDGDGKQKVVDPLELFILFMTPWRNPNSIFVYMLIILNVLGKMNEVPPQ
eukprot:CAMPEP_0178706978 /NCGR_PEP_ID=MMETSP0699-20121125/15727_1 /TAXON_ID=265572 /ORGANISM="Extubocellulus spinifer, Strain CCMP396" /LENGTH=116 /DNA_ID=CAMNT_0020354879 /DNA_START=107 /DNA_END=457 /DNA_ORIENTATION=-